MKKFGSGINIPDPQHCKYLSYTTDRGAPRGDAQDARASPLPPLCIPPSGHVQCASPPPQPERLIMRKDEAVDNKKKK
jgi:hypothetical protein